MNARFLSISVLKTLSSRTTNNSIYRDDKISSIKTSPSLTDITYVTTLSEHTRRRMFRPRLSDSLTVEQQANVFLAVLRNGDNTGGKV